MRRFLLIFLSFTLLFMTSGFVNNISYAQDFIEEERIIEVSPGIYKIIPTEEETNNFFQVQGWPVSNEQLDISYVGNIINSYDLIYTEKSDNGQGGFEEYRYYRLNFKDTPEAKEIQETINLRKLNETLDSSNNGSDSFLNTTKEDIIIDGFVPEEGDVRIYVNAEAISNKGFFDSEQGCKATLSTSKFWWAIQFGGALIPSRYVIGYFTGAVANAIINEGKYGQGDATSVDRTVYKTGEVYTNGQWKSYYITNQYEVYWKIDQIAYTDSTRLYVYSTSLKTYYPPYYNPIEWIPTSNFNNNQQIIDITLARYNNNLGLYYDNGFDGDYYTSYWNTPWSMVY